MRRTNRRKLQSNGMFPCAKTSSFQGKQRMLGFEHFESLEALRDFGALQAELGRNAEAREQEIRERERDNSFEKKGSRRLGNVKFRLSKLSKHSAWMRLGCLVSPQVIVDFSRAFNFVCALLDFPDRHTAFGAKHLQVSNAPWVWKLKNSTILRAQGIMLQFRTMSNLEFQRCKQNLTPGFWKHLKHLRQKSQ